MTTPSTGKFTVESTMPTNMPIGMGSKPEGSTAPTTAPCEIYMVISTAIIPAHAMITTLGTAEAVRDGNSGTVQLSARRAKKPRLTRMRSWVSGRWIDSTAR